MSLVNLPDQPDQSDEVTMPWMRQQWATLVRTINPIVSAVSVPSTTTEQTSNTTTPLVRVDTPNGWYIKFSDGTLLQGGTINVPSTGTAYNTARVNYPTSFPATAAPVITSIGIPDPSGDATTPCVAQIKTSDLNGFNAYMARVIVAGAGGGHFTQDITLSWIAFGY